MVAQEDDPLPPVRASGTVDLQLKLGEADGRRGLRVEGGVVGGGGRRIGYTTALKGRRTENEENVFLDQEGEGQGGGGGGKGGGVGGGSSAAFDLSVDIVRAGREVVEPLTATAAAADDARGDNGHKGGTGGHGTYVGSDGTMYYRSSSGGGGDGGDIAGRTLTATAALIAGIAILL